MEWVPVGPAIMAGHPGYYPFMRMTMLVSLFSVVASAGSAYGQVVQSGLPVSVPLPSAPLAASGVMPLLNGEIPSTRLSPASVPAGVQAVPKTAISRDSLGAKSLLGRLAATLDFAGNFDGSAKLRALVDPGSVRAAALAGSRSSAEPSDKSRAVLTGQNPEPPAPGGIPGRTPLDKHVAFFDRDGDGVITMGETRASLRELGLGRARAAGVALFIHAGLSAATSDSWRDTALLRIRVGNIHRGIHPSDTGIYDAEGRFVPEAFDRVFDDFSKSQKDRLNEVELALMIEANSKRRPGAAGKIGAKGEFALLITLAADGSDTVGGKTVKSISRERLSQLYDGTLFYRLAGRRLP